MKGRKSRAILRDLDERRKGIREVGDRLAKRYGFDAEFAAVDVDPGAPVLVERFEGGRFLRVGCGQIVFLIKVDCEMKEHAPSRSLSWAGVGIPLGGMEEFPASLARGEVVAHGAAPEGGIRGGACGFAGKNEEEVNAVDR